MENSHPFYRFLEKRIHHPLPGKDAHNQMMPSPLYGTRNSPSEPEKRAFPSSVMVLLDPTGLNQLEIILTLRNQSLVHGGQICFPGGQADPGETVEETALREMEEEIGIGRENVQIAGKLSRLYLGHSNNLITPVVGLHKGESQITVNPEEVQEVFTVSMDTLTDERNLLVKQWELRGKMCEVPCWSVHKVPLWGATAMITNELLSLYREYLETRRR